MAKIDIFKESIIVNSLINPEIDNKIKKILKEEKNKNKGVQISNLNGGYQTKEIFDEELNKIFLIKTAELIYNFFRINENYKIKMQNLWINENYKNCINAQHVHPRSNFSGIYYVQVPENSGELVFTRGDKSVTMMLDNDMFAKNDLSFNSIFKIQPLKNQMILFPSHLIHGVLPNNNDEPRISVAFNVQLLKTNG